MSDATAAPLKILIADDEAAIRNVLQTRLRLAGHQVVTAENGVQALALHGDFDPDLVILDVMMPELDGFQVTERIRRNSDVPIILLTALDGVEERITGLELGADDYMVKPFSPKELEARIRCVMRRCDTAIAAGDGTNTSRRVPVLEVGNLRIDKVRRQVHRGEERIRLTGIEFNMLELLLDRAGEPVSRSEMLDKIWGYRPERGADCRVVDVHISRLRAKLEVNPVEPELILTARGMGYLFRRFPGHVPAAVTSTPPIATNKGFY
jgi:two-component system, OmpR family, response regulator RpaB